MKIPSHVKVGAQDISIILKESIRGEDGEVLGHSKMHFNRIEMAQTIDGESLPEGCVADTFMHELIHIGSFIFGLDLSEPQVSGLAGTLLHIIRDNNLDFLDRDTS